MSKLVRAEVPLSKHGRGNRLASPIGNTKLSEASSGSSVLEVSFKGREIVAYDDILWLWKSVLLEGSLILYQWFEFGL